MAIKFKAEIQGLDKVNKALARYGDAGSAAIRTAIYVKANNIMTDALRVTPLDHNPLRNSWYITRPYKSVGFSEAGFGMEYAHHVHEMPNDKNWSEPGTGNKFLEKPFNKHKTTAVEEIARYAEKHLKKYPDARAGKFAGKSKAPQKPKTNE